MLLFTKLVLAEWCFQVPDAVVWSSSIIDAQVKGAVSVVHFSWTVTSEFLAMNWKTFVVRCMSGRIKCSGITITIVRLGSILFLTSKSELRCPFRCLFEQQCLPIYVFCFRLWHGIQSEVLITTKLCVGARQGFHRQKNKSSSVSDSSFAVWGRLPLPLAVSFWKEVLPLFYEFTNKP